MNFIDQSMIDWINLGDQQTNNSAAGYDRNFKDKFKILAIFRTCKTTYFILFVIVRCLRLLKLSSKSRIFTYITMMKVMLLGNLVFHISI